MIAAAQLTITGEHEVQLTNASETRGLDLFETFGACDLEHIVNGGGDLVVGAVHARDRRACRTLYDGIGADFGHQFTVGIDAVLKVFRFKQLTGG